MSSPSISTIDPIADPRWRALVETHEKSSIFHCPEWLEALREVYGFRPEALTTAGDGESLTNGLVYCRVESRWTGRRLVALPFSDHSRVLSWTAEETRRLVEGARRLVGSRWKSLELRDPDATAGPESDASEFCLHTMELTTPETLFKGLHKSSIQRKVKRARREGLRLITGRADQQLKDFYAMLLLTRRRHGLPPQPLRWFQTLRDRLSDRLTILIAYHGQRPAAGIMTLQHRETVYYKYGASDAALNPLGGMPFLLWTAIEAATREGYRRFDFGRTAVDQPGLMTFKDRFGATRHPLPYLHWPAARRRRHDILQRLAGKVMAGLPDRVLVRIGEFLYPHAA